MKRLKILKKCVLKSVFEILVTPILYTPTNPYNFLKKHRTLVEGRITSMRSRFRTRIRIKVKSLIRIRNTMYLFEFIVFGVLWLPADWFLLRCLTYILSAVCQIEVR